MSWSDGSSGGSCVDDISEEEVEFDENGRRKVKNNISRKSLKFIVIKRPHVDLILVVLFV